ncbi:MAG: serine protease [Candidatus Doudnabacteria bacterium]|nr:serine protease [bacterium]MDZ4243896.1 serine protease [Candidatus Doudnabacteria bacterium]
MKEKIKNVRKSIIAIGFSPIPNQVTIIGSGFSVGKNGEILSAAHIYNLLKPEQINKLMGMAMVKQEESGLENYQWLPLSLVKKDDANDLVIFQIENYQSTLLQPLKLGDSDNVEVGDETYFIGFPYAAQLINDGFGVSLIVNRGIISNVKRDGINPEHPRNWFFVDSISNPGNSGCPLIDVDSNDVVGIMTISFRIKSNTVSNLDIREPMHIAGAKPINLAKSLLS